MFLWIKHYVAEVCNLPSAFPVTNEITFGYVNQISILQHTNSLQTNMEHICVSVEIHKVRGHGTFICCHVPHAFAKSYKTAVLVHTMGNFEIRCEFV